MSAYPEKLDEKLQPTRFASSVAYSVETGITAAADGSQASAPELTSHVNVVAVSAGAADSVRLPAWSRGLLIEVWNKGASTVAVFPPTDGAINGGSDDDADATAIAVGASAKYMCTNVEGQWISQHFAHQNTQ